MVTKPWIVFFSQTGGEIADLAKSLGKWQIGRAHV